MEFDSLFSNSKWDIIKSLSKEKFSPLELAQKSNTTIANVSQQLRLLEASGILKKEKVPNRDKGKPRTLYSISNNYAYLVSATDDFADKRLLELTDYHKIIMRIWFLEDKSLHYYLEKFYWKVEPYLGKMRAIAVSSKNEKIEVIMITHHQDELKKKIGSITIENNKGESKEFVMKFYTDEQLKKLSLENTNVLYDPCGIFSMLKSHFPPV